MPSLQALFDEVAERYEARIIPVFAQFAANFVAWVKPQVDSRVLDLGTGTGIVPRLLVGQVQQVTGVDFAGVMLEVARGIDNRVGYVQGDAHQLPFADNSFDMVTASFGFNGTNPRRVLPEIARVLRSGGRLCFQEWGGLHWVDDVLRELFEAYGVDDDEAPAELVAWRDYLAVENMWYRDFQTEADYREDLPRYGFQKIKAREYAPVAVPNTLEGLIDYKLAWPMREMELAAMEESARGDFMDELRRRLYEQADGSGTVIYNPLIMRVQAIRR
ncbi:MAG: methyltransferase domain-containing protein [Anaerolineales bacterium]|nr:methyltransferase domain-containing protein [Anaerolineales bacterium]